MEEPGNKDSEGGLVVAVALNGGSKSKQLIRWALEKFISEEEDNVSFKLIHVYPKIIGVPTPMGGLIPMSQVRNDVETAYRKDVEWQKMEALLPFKKLCSSRKVMADIVLIESDEVANSLSKEVTKCGIQHLVIGSSSLSNGLFSWKVKGQLLSSQISECSPGFCTVYVISKGKLESLRPPGSESKRGSSDDSSTSSDLTDPFSVYDSSSLGFLLKDLVDSSTIAMVGGKVQRDHLIGKSGLKTDLGSSYFGAPFSSPTPSLANTPPSPSRLKPAFSQAMRETTDLNRCGFSDLRDEEDGLNCVAGISLSQASGTQSVTGECRTLGSFTPQSTMNSPSSNPELGGHVGKRFSSDQMSVPTLNSMETQPGINIELERMRMELRHIRGMYYIAQNETIDATRKLSDLSKLRFEEAMKLKEISDREELAKALVMLEKDKTDLAKREAEYARECVIQESYQRKEAERFAAREAKEREKLKHVLGGPAYQYHKFSWDEIVNGSSNFSEDLKIGMGAYGTVYKCKLHHTTMAVKVLHSKEDSQCKQFQQELEILSRIRHPHLLLLLGACPEKGCLVYEYMENGNLEDRLLRKNSTSPLKWYDRFRIAWEVASALLFLHSTKPKPIIHRDLKPANILLDKNHVSKIGDAGLCTMLNLEPSTMSVAVRTVYKDTSPVGTLCYIDPEYQRTGMISTKSDVYALGMVILQLLTAKPAVGIAHLVEAAIDEDRLLQILDQYAGEWPIRETTELALLGLQCVELRGKDRPNLKDNILPSLERMKEVADEAKDIAVNGPLAPPSHFICPILKDVMEDPCVAADGYTYDRKAIAKWITANDTSPTTKLPLPNKNLISNYTLHYAIMEWKTKRKSPKGSLNSR